MATARRTADEQEPEEKPTRGTRAGRKSAAKKAPAKKTPAKKTAARKTAAKKTSGGSRNDGARTEQAENQQNGGQQNDGQPVGGDEAGRAGKPAAMKVARSAAQQLSMLTGRQPECVVGLQRSDDDGWLVDLEVLETRRIPDSTDILATYRVETDADGDLVGYQRLRRYSRGKGSDWDGDGGSR
jgi:hypothetical protein